MWIILECNFGGSIVNPAESSLKSLNIKKSDVVFFVLYCIIIFIIFYDIFVSYQDLSLFLDKVAG